MTDVITTPEATVHVAEGAEALLVVGLHSRYDLLRSQIEVAKAQQKAIVAELKEIMGSANKLVVNEHVVATHFPTTSTRLDMTLLSAAVRAKVEAATVRTPTTKFEVKK